MTSFAHDTRHARYISVTIGSGAFRIAPELREVAVHDADRQPSR